MIENYELIAKLATEDVEVLRRKGKTYGNSWKKRGGVGAFMMLARKWDRLENMSFEQGWDVFAAGRNRDANYDVLEEIADLRRYLLLVEAHIRDQTSPAVGEPVPRGYVDQDR